MRIALYMPDIPQNTGTILRMAACMGLPVDIIEPCGFILDDRRMKRAGMDYLEKVDLTRHMSWQAFYENRGKSRIVLLSTKAEKYYADFAFKPDDILLLGRESAGVPDEVHAVVDGSVKIPMAKDMRSINVAVSAAMVTGEALRQVKGFPS